MNIPYSACIRVYAQWFENKNLVLKDSLVIHSTDSSANHKSVNAQKILRVVDGLKQGKNLGLVELLVHEAPVKQIEEHEELRFM